MVPLEIVVPQKDGSSFRPAGVKGGIPLAYTPDEKGGYLLLPSKKTGDQTLNVTVAHLSSKDVTVTYVTEKGLLDSFFYDKATSPSEEDTNPRDKCKQEVTVSGEKVKIGPKSQGWSLENDDAILACLSKGIDGKVQVRIANRIDYIMSVAATGNVRLTTSRGDLEDKVIKLVSNILPGENAETLLGRDGKMVGSINPVDLPATIELQGQLRAFASEVAVKLLSFTVGILTGEGSGSKTLEMLDKSLKAGLGICIQDSLAPLSGGTNFGQIVAAITGCFGVLLEGIAVDKAVLMADAAAIVDTVFSSMSDLRLTPSTDKLRVQIVRVR